MKRFSAVMIVVVLVCGLFAQTVLGADPRIADVPASHWAYQAVKKLVSEGYLGLYPDNTFRGDQPVDRFTLAVIVARLLGDTVSGKTAMTREEADLLKRLTGEFRQELVALALRTKTLEDALAQFERDRLAMSADMAVSRDDGMKIRADLATAVLDILKLKEQVNQLEKRLDSLSAEQQKQAGQQQERTDLLTEDLRKVAEALEAHEKKNQEEQEALRKELEEARQRSAELEKQLKTWRLVSIILIVAAGVLGLMF